MFNVNFKTREIFYEELTERLHKGSEEIVIDFLNLIFGVGDDTILFWNEIIRPEILIHFDYDIGQFPISITAGGLLHSILYHCRIKLNYSNKI